MLIATSSAASGRGSGECGRSCALGVVEAAKVRAWGAARLAGIVVLAVDERSIGIGSQGAGPSCLAACLRQPLPIVPSAWPRKIDDAEGRCGAGLVGLQNPIRVDTDPPPCRNPRRAAPGERRSHFAMRGRIERMAQSRAFLRRCPQHAANGGVEVSVCFPLLTATPQQRPRRAHFRHCKSATRSRMLRLQSTSPLCGTVIVAVLRFTRQRWSNIRSGW
jgi:hypothetical protein